MKQLFLKTLDTLKNSRSVRPPDYILSDPEAGQADCNSLKSKSTLQFRKLRIVSSSQASFVAGMSERFKSLFVIGFGGLLGIGTAFKLQETPEPGLVALMLIGLALMGVGVYLYRSADKPVYFDRKNNLFWTGKRPNLSGVDAGPDSWCRISDLKAIQVLAERVLDEDGPDIIYELNLILADQSRRNVVRHATRKTIEQDGADLATWLDVPFWNGLPDTINRSRLANW